ncbi:GntR family transcriptional regulator [Bermanella marisrubri]|uniref:Probable transcriptional regulator n=1 Tax=Bermanella marisrubri TaxID=207949 RepID=Q1N1E2_9GAMM|nr:GntR family transcriptional regulator [Bermanella marisrubri]EAT12108.1 probable transcriptional regulator [Oceanobacter sp. RED65] [Bermanella marisrubri]QIZ83572.1 GntR family transcriptional regulator [Bermanella marisrubri]
MDIEENAGTQTLSDRVFEQIQEAIVSGEIPQGEKVSESGIGQRYGVSRGPLREAIRRLEGRKLLVRIPHSGVRVVTLTHEELIEIYQIRESLEALACELAAENMSDNEIEELGALLQQHQDYIHAHGGKRYYQQEGDWDFHYRIIHASGNKRLIDLLCGELYQLIRMYRNKGSQSTSRPLKAFEEHQQIFNALKQRDGELAGILMGRHIRASRRNIQDQIAEQINDQQK